MKTQDLLHEVWPQRSLKFIQDNFYAKIFLAHSFMKWF